MQRRFSDDEIFRAIKDLSGWKAPDIDGFHVDFFRIFWDCVKSDVVSMFDEFYRNSRLPYHFHVAIISLILKEDEATDISRFRPISVMSALYRMFAKVLANRLKSVANQIFSDSQFAFIRNKRVQHSFIMASEVVHSLQHSGQPYFVLKLDFHKAFDSVHWPFLFQMLANFGIGRHFSGWVRELVSNAQAMLNINGVRGDRFKLGRGLRQGCPLSPLLFNVVAEGLVVLLKRVAVSCFIDPLQVSDFPGHILTYADDMIIFCRANVQQMLRFKLIIQFFLSLSGLSLNETKCSITMFNVHANMLAAGKRIFNCTISDMPIMYLGLPLQVKHLSSAAWAPTLQKVKRKLLSWQSSYLSIAGRLTLVRHVLSTIPEFFMSMFVMPVGVEKQLTRLLAGFLWSGCQLKGKRHLIGWRSVVLPRRMAGLGIPAPRLRSIVLVAKQCWLAHQPDNPCARLLLAKYGAPALIPVRLGTRGLALSHLRKSWLRALACFRDHFEDSENFGQWLQWALAPSGEFLTKKVYRSLLPRGLIGCPRMCFGRRVLLPVLESWLG